MVAIAVTGSTGGLGGRVARRLSDAGVGQTLVVRDPSRAPGLPGSTVVRASYDDGAAARAALIRFTMLRDNLYADFVPLMVRADDVIRGPGGDGRAAVVGRDDIADAAVAVLRDPDSHVDTTYNLTGPEALSLAEMADVVSGELGRRITYEDETLDEAYASRAHYGAPDWQVEAWVSTYLAVAKGDLERVGGDVQRLSGHPASALRDVIRSER